MSEPSYAITTEHDPNIGRYNKWRFSVTRLSDDAEVHAGIATDEREAIADAMQWLRQQREQREPGHTTYVSEDGIITGPPEPQSLRA